MGGKKLSANEQLLVLQDVLMLRVSELQLAAQRLGEHWITMSTGTNQEKRGAKEAYAKVKVEVATLEAEVEELKDVLWVLKASKADKEVLEGGDINSILFASAGLGGGGSRGGAGLLKSSSPGVDSGGNHEVTFKSKVRLKSVPRLDVETSTSVWEVINLSFVSNLQSTKNELNQAAAALFPEVHSKTLMFSNVILTLVVINSVKEMYPLEHAVIMKDPKAAMNIEQTLDYIT